jgi:glycosyltransferase involved in cell wall biosynthesis
MKAVGDRVTAVVTAYNAERYISRCIDSALEQSLGAVRVIVVDDGSSDQTARVVTSYGDRVRLIQLESNQGPAVGRTRGLFECVTEYVAFLDADDFWEPTFARETVEFLDTHPDIVAASTGNCKRHWNGGECVRPVLDEQDKDYYGAGGAVCPDFYRFWSKYRAVLTGSVMMRTAMALKTEGQRADLRRTQDLEFWGYLATFGRWAFIPKPLLVTDERALTPRERLGKFKKDFMFFREIEVDDWAKRIRPRLVGRPESQGFEEFLGHIATWVALSNAYSFRFRESYRMAAAWRDRLDPGLGSVLRRGVGMGPVCWPLVCLALRLRETIKAYRHPLARRLSARGKGTKPPGHTICPAPLKAPARIEIDEASESQWDDICLQFRDATINQTWGFGALMSGEHHLSHVLLRRGDAILAAAQVRIVRVPVLNAGIAYVGTGPMWRRKDSNADLDSLQVMLAALRQEYAVRRRLLLRVQPNVFDDSPDAAAVCSAYGQAEFTGNQSHHQTFLLDLAPSLGDLRAHLHQKWRNGLNNAEKNHLRLREGIEDALFGEFRTIYNEMRERKTYSDHVDIQKYAVLQSRLPAALKPWILIAESEGAPVAGAVFTTTGDTGVYLLGATNEAGLHTKASYLIQWRAIQWFRENGYRRYDLGGVDPIKTPTTYQFKSRICGKDPKVCTRVGEFFACESLASRLVVKSGETVRSWKSRTALPSSLVESAR